MGNTNPVQALNVKKGFDNAMGHLPGESEEEVQQRQKERQAARLDQNQQKHQRNVADYKEKVAARQARKAKLAEKWAQSHKDNPNHL